MAIDRFTSEGPVFRNYRNTERYHPASSGSGTGVDGQDGSTTNITGPWSGAASAGDTLGYNPVTGERYYVDDAGLWQPVPYSDTTQEKVAGLAPTIGVIPTEVSSQTRDDGDYHTIQYDDYVVVYRYPAIEVRRQLANGGGFDSITVSVAEPLIPSARESWLREYTLVATTPLVTNPVDPSEPDVVEFPLPAPTADGQRIDIIRNSAVPQYINGSISNDPTGAVINEDNRKIQLVSLGTTWLWSH